MPDSVDLCATITAIRKLRNHGNYPSGTDRDEIWAAVLAPLARLSTEVTILDRYILTPKPGGHVEWLIEGLGRTLMRESTVRILGGWPEKPRPRRGHLSEDEVSDLAHKRLAPLAGSERVKDIDVVLAKAWDKGRKGPHNRHLRFSCGMAVTTHEGFDRLSTKQVNGVDGFTWKVVQSPQRLADLSKGEGNVNDCLDKVQFKFPEGPPTATS